MAGIGFSILVVGIFIAVVWAMICANNNQENKNAPKPAPFIIAICSCLIVGMGLVIADIGIVRDETKSILGEANSESSSTKDAYGHNRSYAIVIAENVVKSKLKSPSTADFCKNYEYTVSCSKNTWTIKGYVDAQNSFGAMLRSDFTVKITFTGKSNYTVDLCSIS